MQTLVIAAQKGGAGKTTIAIHLAVAASEQRRVIVADTDPQRSLADWGDRRGEREPSVYGIPTMDLSRFLRTAADDGVDLVVVDTPPHSSLDAASVFTLADLIVVPVRPTILDLRAAERTAALVRASGRPAVAVLSAVPARSPEAVDAIDLLRERCGFEVAPVRIGDRRAYSRALAIGAAVTEFPRATEARNEVCALASWLHDFMAARHHDPTEATCQT